MIFPLFSKLIRDILIKTNRLEDFVMNAWITRFGGDKRAAVSLTFDDGYDMKSARFFNDEMKKIFIAYAMAVNVCGKAY